MTTPTDPNDVPVAPAPPAPAGPGRLTPLWQWLATHLKMVLLVRIKNWAWDWLRCLALVWSLCFIATWVGPPLWNLVNYLEIGLIVQMLPQNTTQPTVSGTPDQTNAEVAGAVGGIGEGIGAGAAGSGLAGAAGATAAGVARGVEQGDVVGVRVSASRPLNGLGLSFVATSWQLFWERARMANWLFLLIGLPLLLFGHDRMLPLVVEQGRSAIEVAVIKRQRFRAFLLKCSAGSTLVLIVGIMVIGLLVFIGADRLVSLAAESEKRGVNLELSDTSYVVSTLSTRIGAALILIFLVRNLVSLYRYNVKLAAFYDTRADAIQLAGDDPDHLNELAPTISADTVEFGDVPKSPLEEATSGLRRLTKELADRVPHKGH